LTEVWNAAKNCLWILGASESKFKIKPEMTYYDVLYLNEVPRPEHLYRWPYMLKADEFTIGSVSDWGCGNGLFLLYAWSMRPHVHWYSKGEFYDHEGEPHSCIMGFPFAHGIDCSPVAIGHAKKAEQHTAKVIMFEVGDIMSFDKEEYVDTVTILEVLEHLNARDRRVLVENAFKACRHRVVATVPRVPVAEPNHQIAAFREDQLRDLFHMFPRVFISGADSLRWLVVGIKRQAEQDENWEVEL
jgi:SAM-dependent methyltransferase